MEQSQRGGRIPLPDTGLLLVTVVTGALWAWSLPNLITPASDVEAPEALGDGAAWMFVVLPFVVTAAVVGFAGGRLLARRAGVVVARVVGLGAAQAAALGLGWPVAVGIFG